MVYERLSLAPPLLLTFLSVVTALIAVDTQSMLVGVASAISFFVGVAGLIDYVSAGQ